MVEDDVRNDADNSFVKVPQVNERERVCANIRNTWSIKLVNG